ncbi:MAG: hypothetical protein H6810_06975 [Phycisphaeraceae bacterium]|nr:MAG: hypothetical protein H6810_06975 [Phycisphaeraceae bacterium]
MKTLLGWIIWVCVGFGAISAVTAYFVPTNLDPDLYTSNSSEKSGEHGYLLISSAAGPMVPHDGKTAPQWPEGTELTPQVLGAMSAVQEDGEPLVKRVHVGEFSWGRWSHKYWFIGSVVLLTLCGLGQRALSGGGAVKKGSADPSESIAGALADVAALRDELPTIHSDRARLEEIVARLGELQQTHLAAFAETRDVLISRHGMGGFARIMDAFAGAERKVNRAWSAAADGLLGESIDNIEMAVPMFEETKRRLG